MTPTGHSITREEIIASDLAEVRRLQTEIEEALQAQRFPERDVFSIKLALEEALVNAIKHGNQMDRAKKVVVRYQVSHEFFEIQISDEGTGYNPNDVPDPTDPENLERPCGRGLFMIKHYMDEVSILGRGNTISLRKTRKESAPEPDEE